MQELHATSPKRTKHRRRWELPSELFVATKLMKFHEALEYIQREIKLRHITREDWPFKLCFCPMTQILMLKDLQGNEITPYVISYYEWNYEWEID